MSSWCTLGWIVSAVLAATVLHGLAHAQEPRAAVVFDIREQPLGDALNAFARQSGWEVLFPARFGGRPIAHRVGGVLSPRQALCQLLADTELGFTMVGPRTVAILPRSTRSATDACATRALLLDGTSEQHDSPDCLPGGEVRERLACPLERKPRGHLRAKLARAVPGE